MLILSGSALSLSQRWQRTSAQKLPPRVLVFKCICWNILPEKKFTVAYLMIKMVTSCLYHLKWEEHPHLILCGFYGIISFFFATVWCSLVLLKYSIILEGDIFVDFIAYIIKDAIYYIILPLFHSQHLTLTPFACGPEKLSSQQAGWADLGGGCSAPVLTGFLLRCCLPTRTTQGVSLIIPKRSYIFILCFELRS